MRLGGVVIVLLLPTLAGCIDASDEDPAALRDPWRGQFDVQFFAEGSTKRANVLAYQAPQQTVWNEWSEPVLANVLAWEAPMDSLVQGYYAVMFGYQSATTPLHEYFFAAESGRYLGFRLSYEVRDQGGNMHPVSLRVFAYDGPFMGPIPDTGTGKLLLSLAAQEIPRDPMPDRISLPGDDRLEWVATEPGTPAGDCRPYEMQLPMATVETSFSMCLQADEPFPILDYYWGESTARVAIVDAPSPVPFAMNFDRTEAQANPQPLLRHEMIPGLNWLVGPQFDTQQSVHGEQFLARLDAAAAHPDYVEYWTGDGRPEEVPLTWLFWGWEFGPDDFFLLPYLESWINIDGSDMRFISPITSPPPPPESSEDRIFVAMQGGAYPFGYQANVRQYPDGLVTGVDAIAAHEVRGLAALQLRSWSGFFGRSVLDDGSPYLPSATWSFLGPCSGADRSHFVVSAINGQMLFVRDGEGACQSAPAAELVPDITDWNQPWVGPLQH